MIVDLRHVVASDKFRKNWATFLAKARDGEGPLAIRENSEVVGVFLTVEEYEALCAAELTTLLKKRMKQPTVSTAHVRGRLRKLFRKHQKKT